MTEKQKVDAWMPLWIGSYLADTMDLDRHEHGGYLLLLIAYWRNKGPLPDDDKKLANVTKCKTRAEWRDLRATLAPFFEIADGQWVHGRADDELEAAGKRKNAAVEKASKGGKAKAAKHHPSTAPSTASGTSPSNASSKAQALLGGCPTPSPTPSPPENSVPTGTGGADAPPAVDNPEPRTPDPEAQRLWREGVALLVGGGMEEKPARRVLGKVARDFPQVIREALDIAIKATPARPEGYLVQTCRKLESARTGETTVPGESVADYLARIEAERRADEECRGTPEQVAALVAKSRAEAVRIRQERLAAA